MNCWRWVSIELDSNATTGTSYVVSAGVHGSATTGWHVAAWVCGPRAATAWLLHAAVIDTAALGLDRGINPPGISVTIAALLSGLETVRPGAAALVKRDPDPAVEAIVGPWPASFAANRARALGFAPQGTVVDLIHGFIADDLEATRTDRGL